MFIQAYNTQLNFAYCYRVYFRWQTLRNVSCGALTQLNAAALDDLVESYGVAVLECSASDTEVLVMVSLQPQDTISASAGKLKGRVTKWLNEKLGSTEPCSLSRGYSRVLWVRADEMPTGRS